MTGTSGVTATHAVWREVPGGEGVIRVPGQVAVAVAGEGGVEAEERAVAADAEEGIEATAAGTAEAASWRTCAGRSRCERMIATPANAARARDLVAEELTACGRSPDQIHAAKQIVTELVSNASEHVPGTEIRLYVALNGGSPYIGVWDESSEPPRADTGGGTGSASLLQENGRGLVIVRTLARVWGCTATYPGKIVWAVLENTPVDPGGVAASDRAEEVRSITAGSGWVLSSHGPHRRTP